MVKAAAYHIWFANYYAAILCPFTNILEGRLPLSKILAQEIIV